MKIKKVSGTAVLDGNVIDSLGDSPTNAPSQRVVTEAFESLKENLEVLWENTNVETDFGAKTITLNSNNYDYSLVLAYRNQGVDDRTISIIIEKNKSADLEYTDYFDNTVRNWNRQISITNDTTVTFTATTINGAETLNALKPYLILGIGGKRSEIDVITDGTPVKTGRKVDEKDEWVKRVSLGTLPAANSSITIPDGLNHEEVLIINIIGNASDSTGAYQTNLGGFDTRFAVNPNGLVLKTKDESYASYTGYADIYFKYKEEV